MRYLNQVCVGIALGGLIASATLWHELRTQRQLMAEWRKAHPFAALSAAPTSDPAATLAISPPRRPVTGTGHATEVPARSTDHEVEKSRIRLEDPEHRAKVLSQLRLVAPLGFPGLVEELGLSDDEAKGLFDLLTEHQLEMSTLPMPPRDNAALVSPAPVRETALARRELQGRHDEALAALLGDARYGKWKEYQEARPARQQAEKIEAMMKSQGQPLSETQELALGVALVAESKRQRKEMQDMLGNVSRPSPTDPAQLMEETFRRRSESNRRIVAAAEPHLSAQQLALLRGSLDQQLAASGVANRSGR